jgi:hypothetical protein
MYLVPELTQDLPIPLRAYMHADQLVIHCPTHGDVARFIEHLATRSDIAVEVDKHMRAHHCGDAQD